MATNRGAWCVPCLASFEILQELCRKEKLTCDAIGITKKNINDYEVEYLCDYKIQQQQEEQHLGADARGGQLSAAAMTLDVKDMELYLVKWKGWPESANTWEPKKHLKCSSLLKQFYTDQLTFLTQSEPGKPPVLKNNIKKLNPAIVDFVVKKAKQRIALQRWEEELNRKKSHKERILVENRVDLEGPPMDFYYINEYKASPGINLAAKALVGCECLSCPSDNCCPAGAGVQFAYNEHGQLRIQPGQPIYECNSCCNCGPDCINRVVQKGTPYPLCIFRTSDGRGWGVKTLQKIKKNSFVMEYVGEVITSEEAERRGQLYDSKGITYLFDLDYASDEFTVDAARYGNVSHFVNHSCDPNLQVFNVFIENLDIRVPRIALFSSKTIKVGEELTFDYQMKGSGDLSTDSIDISPARKRPRTVCKCGSTSCRGYLN